MGDVKKDGPFHGQTEVNVPAFPSVHLRPTIRHGLLSVLDYRPKRVFSPVSLKGFSVMVTLLLFYER
jgi:hypothetical protein